MRQSDRKRFAALLTGAAEVYGKAISSALADVWWAALATYAIEDVERAFAAHLANTDAGRFMPKPADVIRMLEGSSDEAAMVAWSKLDGAVRRVGTYASVAFDDPLIHRVVEEMGGWIAFGRKTEDEWPFVGNEFRTRYRGYRSRHEIPAYPSVLVGIIDAENGIRGFRRLEAITYVGDSQTAMSVVARGTNQPVLGIVRAPQPALPAPSNRLAS